MFCQIIFIIKIYQFVIICISLEREYRCLGNWEEDGILYTYTQRRDMPGHQCFVRLKSNLKTFSKLLLINAFCICIKGWENIQEWRRSFHKRSGSELCQVSIYNNYFISSFFHYNNYFISSFFTIIIILFHLFFSIIIILYHPFFSITTFNL